MWPTAWSKRQLETFHLVLGFGEVGGNGCDGGTGGGPLPAAATAGPTWSQFGTAAAAAVPKPGTAAAISPSCDPDPDLRCQHWVEFDWTVGEDESTVALKLQSQVMVALPAPEDWVRVRLVDTGMTIVTEGEEGESSWTFQPKIAVKMAVEKRREPLRVLRICRTSGTGGGGGTYVDAGLSLAKVFPGDSLEAVAHLSIPEGPVGIWTTRIQQWRSLITLNLSSCGLTVLPPEISALTGLQKLYLDNNKLATLPVELGLLGELRVLRADQNTLISVPIELRQCSKLVELSLEQNKLVRPLLDFRTMLKLQTLRLFGNPLDFLPEILPCKSLRYLSLANVRIEASEDLSVVSVTVETDASAAAGYFTAAKHKLSTFFSLVFRYSSCQVYILALKSVF
ncbi:hypothetical protein CBR_g8997 [Chara braunii]|uniref:Uncharacterized protein n=1 Tax=Chara braunii TaxID=69332 RepID=A0A388KNG3_CHABU|nr:hypothetical protein CBR_g8997 [Chara braunii]|eukprot:GBG71581.1 hypothetical protein CBR_g8997 [Chara braunii]